MEDCGMRRLGMTVYFSLGISNKHKEEWNDCMCFKSVSDPESMRNSTRIMKKKI